MTDLCLIARGYIEHCLESTSTYDHRVWKIGLPVRSAVLKPHAGRLVVGWVTTSESLLLYVGAHLSLLTRWVRRHCRLIFTPIHLSSVRSGRDLSKLYSLLPQPMWPRSTAPLPRITPQLDVDLTTFSVSVPATFGLPQRTKQ
ncbi:hypothetical protein BP01DRAFT_18180 [Aspergillus saccharolyticus JOP 1030-1]|uniref:Uncharacterized protein n=1 Tax=Aspergillus saccharolyticus JOP 1030-1 TaxID=1450539 RepID=A0A318ZJP4_9EURO|nr:hypothetical protein BP01DRAFT_18180 [Aspergillus saccharolyticus JOP 1030-1]PYH46604.1 hypothetical protein BP01DRAFT_18180 [Aspergillus saccharolyticus JOP 1030-1]